MTTVNVEVNGTHICLPDTEKVNKIIEKLVGIFRFPPTAPHGGRLFYALLRQEDNRQLNGELTLKELNIRYGSRLTLCVVGSEAPAYPQYMPQQYYAPQQPQYAPQQPQFVQTQMPSNNDCKQ